MIVGSFEIEATFPDAGANSTEADGIFLFASDLPTCFENSLANLEPGSCCFQEAGTVPHGLDMGGVTMGVDSFATWSISVNYQSDAGDYSAAMLPSELTYLSRLGVWLVQGGDPGDAGVQPFQARAIFYYEGAEPVLDPPLDELASLPIGHDWTVPLTPSELYFDYLDRVVISVEGVGRIICETPDDGGTPMAALVVPASLLANFSGYTGTITVSRDFLGWIDAGTALVGCSVGVRVGTAQNAVSFTP